MRKEKFPHDTNKSHILQQIPYSRILQILCILQTANPKIPGHHN